MNPKASLKSLKVKVRPIASRPGVSDQPANCPSADFRASAYNRSVMLASRFHTGFTLTPRGTIGSIRPPPNLRPQDTVQPRPMAAHPAGNHDGEVTTVPQGI